MKSKATNLIEKRDKLSAEITKYWNIINVENVVNRNYKRNYDLKALFDTIKSLSEQRVTIKMKSLALNLGFKNFNDLPKDCIQFDIFRLCELQELKVRLSKIKTLNPKLKIAKGKKNLNKVEALTSNWIKARIDELNLEIINVKKRISDFNESAELDDTVPMAIAA